jgi:hypothetical protein
MDEIPIRANPNQAIFCYTRSGAGGYGFSHRSLLLYPDYFVQCWRTNHSDGEWGELGRRRTGFERRVRLSGHNLREIELYLDRMRGIRATSRMMDASDRFMSEKFDIYVDGSVGSDLPDVEMIWSVLKRVAGIEKKPLDFSPDNKQLDQQYALQRAFWLLEEIELTKDQYLLPKDAEEPSWSF